MTMRSVSPFQQVISKHACDPWKVSRWTLALLILFLSPFDYALAGSPKVLTLSFTKLAETLKEHNILLIPLRKNVLDRSYPVPTSPNLNQAGWVRYIKTNFDNYGILQNANQPDRVYLLPQGISNSDVTEALQGLSRSVQSVFSGISRAEKLKEGLKPGKPELQAGEFKQLQKLGKLAKAKGIHYRRFVNPSKLAEAYSFDVQHIASLDMMLPTLLNGEPVEQQLEVYINPQNVYTFISERSWNLSRTGDTLYLTTPDNPKGPAFAIQQKPQQPMVIANKTITPKGETMGYIMEISLGSFKSEIILATANGPLSLFDIATITQ